MLRSGTSARALLGSLAVWLAFLALPAFAQHAVSRVTIVAKPRLVSGTCPATIEFAATIYVGRRPVFVDFDLVTRAIDLDQVWAKLRVLAPTSIASSQAVVELQCR